MLSSSFSLQQHVDALLLALASSTDNFAVGLAMGLAGSVLPVWSNALIAFCNATGAYLASWGGSSVTASMQHNQTTITLVAALAFGLLALQEFRTYALTRTRNCRPPHTMASPKNSPKRLDLPQVLKLALPMTLNNLVGGVAGGVAGLSPHVTAVYALVASFMTMAVGHWTGRRIWMGRNSSRNQTTMSTTGVDPSLCAGCLFGLLSLLTLRDALT